MNSQRGFTLIELMIVVSIIGVIAAIAVPQFSPHKAKSLKSEGIVLASAVRYDIQDYVDATGQLPENNAMAGLAEKDNIRGKYVKSIGVERGTIMVTFDESEALLKGYYFKLVPEINKANPTGPIVWTFTDKDKDKKQQ